MASETMETMTPGHSMVLLAAGRAKALAEARTQFQAETRKAEAQCARFAKRQAAMLEYERCLANSPYKPQRGSAGTAGEASRGGSSEASASARPPQQFREGMNCPDCLTIYPPLIVSVNRPAPLSIWGLVVFSINDKDISIVPKSFDLSQFWTGAKGAVKTGHLLLYLRKVDEKYAVM